MEPIVAKEITKKDSNILTRQQFNATRGIGFLLAVWLVDEDVAVEIKLYAEKNSAAKNKPTHRWFAGAWVKVDYENFVTPLEPEFDITELSGLYEDNEISMTKLTSVQLARAVAIGAPHHLWLTPKSFFVLAIKSSIPTHIWQNNEWVLIYNPAKEAKVELNDGHFHEVQHTAHLMQDMFNNYILDHPAVMQTPELKEAADKAMDVLCDFYQKVGAYKYEKLEEVRVEKAVEGHLSYQTTLSGYVPSPPNDPKLVGEQTHVEGQGAYRQRTIQDAIDKTPYLPELPKPIRS